MKIYLLALSLLITLSSRAQINLPRAGEIPANSIDKSGLIQAMRSGNYSLQKSLDVIDFDSSNVSFKGNFPFSVSYSLSMSPSDDLVLVGSGGGIYITDV